MWRSQRRTRKRLFCSSAMCLTGDTHTRAAHTHTLTHTRTHTGPILTHILKHTNRQTLTPRNIHTQTPILTHTLEQTHTHAHRQRNTSTLIKTPDMTTCVCV